MTLSEAIRLGAMLKPQAFGVGHEWRVKPGVRGGLEFEEATCAFHAALDAHPCGTKRITGEESTRPLRGALVAPDRDGTIEVIDVPGHWLIVLASFQTCPACPTYIGSRRPTFNLIAHLNDDHRWTREAIADWVETIEAAQASALRGDREAAAVAVGCGETE